MKITIHQPEHFPYLGFFQKMQEADLFVILDDVQFTKENFQNRNLGKIYRISRNTFHCGFMKLHTRIHSFILFEFLYVKSNFKSNLM